jgi:predicted phosphohydrolase
VRIVAVADTHLFHADLRVPEGDVLVHAGDLCRGGDMDELAQAAAWLNALPHPTKIVVPGNHDWAFARDRRLARALFDASVIHLEDEGTTIAGMRFWGSPWQPEFHGWAFNLPRGGPLKEKWALIPDRLDVLITHGPPMGIGDHSAIGQTRVGCADLLSRVREARPRVHLFGHIHEDGGAWTIGETLFANVTTWECERAPTVIDLDIERARVIG